MPLKNWCSIHARWSRSSLKHSIRFCGIFPSLKQNFIAYRSSSCPDCIFEIQHLWQSRFSRVYSNCCCSCSFEREIIKICLSSYKMYTKNIVNFQESTRILNTCTKKSRNLLKAPRIFMPWCLEYKCNIKNKNYFRIFLNIITTKPNYQKRIIEILLYLYEWPSTQLIKRTKKRKQIHSLTTIYEQNIRDNIMIWISEFRKH